MKHCPECNRNYRDADLSYCLDDGCVLLYGPASTEADTAVLKSADAPSEAPTLLKTDDQRSADEADAGHKQVGNSGFLKRWLLAAFGITILSATGYVAYRYLAPRNHIQFQSIAVLPFENDSGNPDNEYLCDGIAESLINSLSQLPDMKVIARSSAFRYKGAQVDNQKIASELGVQTVMTGRVVQRGDNLEISVELMDARNNSQLWGDRYTRKTTDIFALENEIAAEVSEKMRLALSGAERQQLARRPTENLKAYQYYQQGQAYQNRRTHEDVLTAIRFYEKAIDEDQGYALAYAGLAMAYGSLTNYGYIDPREGHLKAEDAARKALALDENLAEAHAALGLAYGSSAPSNHRLGDPELRRAIELSPSLAVARNYLGTSLTAQGRFDESVAEFQKARELDPLSSIIARNLAMPYYVKRDYVRALELIRQANTLGPAFTSSWEVSAYIQNKLFDEALAGLKKAVQERGDDPLLIHDMGLVYAAQGDRTEALRMIKELEEMPDVTWNHWKIAKIYSALNEKDLALTWLERGVAARTITFFLKDDPVWDPIRDDPRFMNLLRQMALLPQ